jgi:hypothetical protein
MDQVGLTRQPFLALMDSCGKIVGFAQQINIRGRIVRLDLFDEIADFGFSAHG